MRSELQLAVLRFYRQAYKFLRSKPEPLRTNLYDYLRKEMEASRNIPRIKFNSIEHKLRQGKNRFAMFREANIDNITRQ